MAKNYVNLALGEKAESFYDPTTKIDIVKGRVVRVPSSWLHLSPVISAALKDGHIVKADDDDFEEAEYKVDHNKQFEEAAKKNKKASSEKSKDSDEDDEDDEDEDDDDDEDEEEEKKKLAEKKTPAKPGPVKNPAPGK